MKKASVIILILCIGLLSVYAQSRVELSRETRNAVAELLFTTTTTWQFSSEAVAEGDIEMILKAAVNTPSSNNSRPWQFNVVTDTALISELSRSGGTKSAPLMIVVSTNNNQLNLLDTGLALGSMTAVAEVLGYGAKVEIDPAYTIRNNSKYTALFDIPSGKNVVAVLYVGKPKNGVDAISSPTVRENARDTKVYVKRFRR
jgi:hypothetical protein